MFSVNELKFYEYMIDNFIAKANVDYCNDAEGPLDENIFYNLFCGIEGAELYHGATKGVIVPNCGNVVFKIPFGVRLKINCCGTEECNELTCNYCEVEEDFYKASIKNHRNQFFAAIHRLKKIILGGKVLLDIYVQEKARPFDLYGSTNGLTGEEVEFDIAEEYLNYANELCNAPVDWAVDFIAYHGENDMEYLDSFLYEYGINDIHDGNVGYIGDRPVIFDYSGYYD